MKKPIIIFATHPKTGTSLSHRIIDIVSAKLQLKKYIGVDSKQGMLSDIWLHLLSDINFDSLGIDYVGVHIIRDPRSLIVSGYNFTLMQIKHGFLKSDNIFYSLNTMSEEDGLIFYMKNYAYDNIMVMHKWPYTNSKFLEIRYEDIMTNYEAGWSKIFKHVGWDTKYLYLTVDENIQLKNIADRKIDLHVTNPEIDLQLWKKYFTSKVIKVFNELFPKDLLNKLGYE